MSSFFTYLSEEEFLRLSLRRTRLITDLSPSPVDAQTAPEKHAPDAQIPVRWTASTRKTSNISSPPLREFHYINVHIETFKLAINVTTDVTISGRFSFLFIRFAYPATISPFN
jgi:hypothetical protein